MKTKMRMRDAGCRMRDDRAASGACGLMREGDESEMQREFRTIGIRRPSFAKKLWMAGVGRAVLAMQVVGLPRSAQGAEGNWPISHIFSPFLTSSMRDFLTARSQGAHPPSQKSCYGGQERPVKTECCENHRSKKPVKTPFDAF